MANGKRRKNKNQQKQQTQANSAPQTEEEFDNMEEETASFIIEEDTNNAAGGYQLDKNWDRWSDLPPENSLDPVEEEVVDEESLTAEEVFANDEGTVRNDVHHCDTCNEDYSVTYRRCPFCDEKANGKSRGPVGTGMDPRHFLGFAISMVLIFTAGFIVVQEVMPLLSPQKEGESTTPSTSTGDGNNYNVGEDLTQPPEGSAEETPTEDTPAEDTPTQDTGSDDSAMNLTPDEQITPEVPPVTDAIPEAPTAPVTPSATIALSSSDVSLKADEVFKLTPQGGGSAVYVSSHPEIASVSADGVVTNLNNQGSTKVIEITVTTSAGTGSCVVRCATGSSSSSTGGTSSSSATGLGTGAAVIANASGGIRIRGGAGTDHAVLATGTNGSDITVLSEAGGGWYQIQFTGSNGKEIGYILGDYIQMK